MAGGWMWARSTGGGEYIDPFGWTSEKLGSLSNAGGAQGLKARKRHLNGRFVLFHWDGKVL